MVLQFLDKRVRRLIVFGQDDCRFHDLSAQVVGDGGDCTFQHRGVFHKRAFDLERSDAVARRFDDIVLSSDVPEPAVFVLIGKVAGVEVNVVFKGGGARLVLEVARDESALIFRFQYGDFAFFAGFNLVFVVVDKAHVVQGAGFSETARNGGQIFERAQHYRAFGLTETFVNFEPGRFFKLFEHFGIQTFAGGGAMFYRG